MRDGFAKNKVPLENVRLRASLRFYGENSIERRSMPGFVSENDETLNCPKEYSKCNGNDEFSEVELF